MKFLLGLLVFCQLASAVTLEDELGQMLMIGFRGTTVDDSPEIVRDILRYHIGSIILFDSDVQQHTPRNVRSPAQLKALIAGLQKLSAEPLLVAADQEGGAVAKLSEKYGFHKSERAQDLGARDDVAYTARAAAVLVGDLESVGINFNLAPVVDLNINPQNPIIGKIGRSFSADPAVVIRQAGAFIDEHRKRGILTTLKHFPGHGSAAGDSHLGLPDITQTWSETELLPFAQLSAPGHADAVMTAHVMLRQLDPDYPATLSQAIIDGVLRRQLGFDGVVLTDDMAMKAITDHFGQREAIRLAVNAGADILVFGNNNLAFDPEITAHVFAILRDLAASGEIPRARIDQAYARIQKMKAHVAPPAAWR